MTPQLRCGTIKIPVRLKDIGANTLPSVRFIVEMSGMTSNNEQVSTLKHNDNACITTHILNNELDI